MLHWFTACTKLFYWTICIPTYLFIDWILHLVKKSLLFYKTLKHWYNFWIGNAYSKMHLGWSYPAPYIILWYVGYNSNLQSSKTHQKYSGKIIVNLNSIRCLRVWLDSCSFILWTCSTLKPRYNEPRYSEFRNIVNKTYLPFWGFTKYITFDIVNYSI